jgi:hypothetical protein
MASTASSGAADRPTDLRVFTLLLALLAASAFRMAGSNIALSAAAIVDHCECRGSSSQGQHATRERDRAIAERLGALMQAAVALPEEPMGTVLSMGS